MKLTLHIHLVIHSTKDKKHIKTFEQHQGNLNISDVSDSKIIEIDSVYDFDKTYLQIEKESNDKVRLTIKSGYRVGEELDIVVSLDKLKSIL
jgi:hypothetical protein